MGYEGYMSLSNRTSWEQNLRTLTAQASQAAELGQWDQVEACYALREEHLLDHPMLPATPWISRYLTKRSQPEL